MRFFWVSFVLLFTVLAAAQSDSNAASAAARTPQQTPPAFLLPVENSSFEFPGAGKRNNNGTIGDFCCTGETATIRTTQGTPIGYIYFYGFSGGINLKSRSAADQLSVLVSGVSDPARLTAGTISRAKSSVEFSALEMKPGFSRQIIAGALEFKVTIQEVKFIDEAHSRFWMDSIKVKVEVQQAPSPNETKPSRNSLFSDRKLKTED
jgi:hypothetical protein